MEIHTPLKRIPKKITEYIKELLILFFAVFLASQAEYLVDHKIHNEWEIEYIRQCVRDLDKDINVLEANIVISENMILGYDSIQNIMLNDQLEAKDHLALYKYNFKYDRRILPIFNENTFNELKYSGHMIFIRKNEVVQGISDYYAQLKIIEANVVSYQNKLVQTENYSHLLFNRSLVEIGEINPSTGYNMIAVDTSAKLLTTEKDVLIQYTNRLNGLETITKSFMLPLLKEQLIKAIDLKQLMNKSYE